MGLLLKHCKVPKYYDQHCLKTVFLLSTLQIMIEISEKKRSSFGCFWTAIATT